MRWLALGTYALDSARATVHDAPLSPSANLRWSVVRPIVTELAPTSMLEIGCGMGAMGMRFARMAGDYTAVEVDEQSSQVATERIAPLGGTVHRGDQADLPTDQQFDLVAAFEVLEHIEDDKTALELWLHRVKPGGHLLLSVPGDPARFGAADTLVGHYRRYTVDGLTRLLSQVGMVDIRPTQYGWPLSYLLEAGRNRVAARTLARDASARSMEEATGGSGRFLQPRKRLVGNAIRWGTAPFALAQSWQPHRGPGLVVVARRPD